MAQNQNKGGRPPKPSVEKRSRILKFRVSTAEYDTLKAKASRSNLTLSEFARQMVLNGQVITLVSPAELRLIAELTREKNNLNQLAKVLNAAGARTLTESLQRIILFYIEVIGKLKRHDRENNHR